MDGVNNMANVLRMHLKARVHFTLRIRHTSGIQALFHFQGPSPDGYMEAIPFGSDRSGTKPYSYVDAESSVDPDPVLTTPGGYLESGRDSNPSQYEGKCKQFFFSIRL